MKDENKPMPLSELSGYIDSVRKSGQGDYVPVVDVGRILDDAPTWGLARVARLALAATILVGIVAYAANSTSELTIVPMPGSESVSDIVSGEGGRVLSVRMDEDGKYKVRVLNFVGVRSLVDRLRENKAVKEVESD